MIGAALKWIGGLFQSLWSTFLKTCTAVLQWCADVLSAVLGAMLDGLILLLTLVVNILPEVPNLPMSGATPALIAQADYFVPLGTVAACVAAIGATYAATYIYKMAKLIRGGG